MFEIQKHCPIRDNAGEFEFSHDLRFQNSSGVRDVLVNSGDEEKILNVFRSNLQARKESNYKPYLDNKWAVTFKSDTIKQIDFLATAGHIAAGRGLYKVMEFLIENGHMDDSGYVDFIACPLSLALRQGHIKVAKLLLQHRVTRHTLSPSVLRPAVQEGSAEIVISLLEQNLIKPKDNQRYLFEAIHGASRGKCPENALATVKALIDGGASVHAEELMPYGTSGMSMKQSPLAYACSLGCFNLGLLFLNEGANPGSGKVRDSKLALELLQKCPFKDTASREIIAFAEELVRRLADPPLVKHPVSNLSDPLKILLSCQHTEGGRYVFDTLLRAGVCVP